MFHGTKRDGSAICVCEMTYNAEGDSCVCPADSTETEVTFRDDETRTVCKCDAEGFGMTRDATGFACVACTDIDEIGICHDGMDGHFGPMG